MALGFVRPACPASPRPHNLPPRWVTDTPWNDVADHKYAHAILQYTDAIEENPSAILYSNRAIAHTKLENYGAAVEDATEAIRLDPEYIKVRSVAHSPSPACSLRTHTYECGSVAGRFTSPSIRGISKYSAGSLTDTC
jgi:tetratricopeptide (TPR) repeat protein